MSAIDSFEHVHAGDVFQLPLYWFIETGNSRRLLDRISLQYPEVNPYHMSLGGGSGEHPALIINNDKALIFTLNYIYDICDDVAPNAEYVMLIKRLKECIENTQNEWRYAFDKNDWDFNAFAHVNTFLNTTLPSDMYTAEPLESHMMLAVGFFILYRMPLESCIASDKLKTLALAMREALPEGEVPLFAEYTQLAIRPAQCFGKKCEDGASRWSYSLEDWYLEQMSSSTSFAM